MISQRGAMFTDSTISPQGSHSLLHPFWAFSSVFGKITILLPDPRDRYSVLEGEFTEHHFIVEMPVAGASAQGPSQEATHLSSQATHSPPGPGVRLA